MKIKSMLITDITTAPGTMVPVITISTESGLVGVGCTIDAAIRNTVIDEHTEDWKEANQVGMMRLVDLVNKYGVCVTNEVYTKWKDVPHVDNGEFKFIPIMSQAHPIVLTSIRNFSDGPIVRVKAVFTHMGQHYTVQSNKAGDLLFQAANNVYGLENTAARAKDLTKSGDIVKAFNFQIDPKLVITDMFCKNFTELLSELHKHTGTGKPQKESKVIKMGRVTLQDIDVNTNKDWVVSLTIENELTSPFNIKYVVTSRANTEIQQRWDAISVTRNQIIGSLPLTLDKETELRQCTPDIFRAYFDMSIASHLAKKGFPKNNHGAQMLSLMSWVGNEPVKDTISALMEVMFDPTRTWAPDTQGMKSVSGKAEGGEVTFRVCHAIGNHYVEGNLETVKLRIFKTINTIQVYLRYPEKDWGSDSVTFNISEKEKLEEYLRATVVNEINFRKNQSK